MTMIKRLAVAITGLAALAAGTANAATILTSTGQYPFSQSGYSGDLRDPSSYPSDFPLPADRNGTLYITGLGTGISSGLNQYSEDVQLQGSGTYAYFTGIAQYSATRNGQDISVDIFGERGKYDVSINFRDAIRGFEQRYDQVFTGNLDPVTHRTITGEGFETVTWIAAQNNGKGASSSSDDPVVFGSFTMTSNSLIIAPPISGPIGVAPPSSGPVVAVPEPATWAMMITGLGLVGCLTRWRRRLVAQVPYAS